LTISTSPVELELEPVDESLVEPPRLPLVVPPVEAPLLEAVEEESLLELLEVLDPETVSPAETSSTLTTVPDAGAYSLVSLSVVWALFSVASALSTWAWAEATSLASVSGLAVVVCEEPLPLPVLPPVPAPLPVSLSLAPVWPALAESPVALPERSPPALGDDGVVVVDGAVTVTVVVDGVVVVGWLGVVVDWVGDVVVGVGLLAVVVVLVVLVVAYETKLMSSAGSTAVLESVVVDDELAVSAALSESLAAVSSSSAW
jgi:hypothetical protein